MPICSSTHVACPSNHIEDNDNELGGFEVRRVGRRGKGDWEDDDDAACNPHAMLSTISFYF
jgi:hypothetical protein